MPRYFRPGLNIICDIRMVYRFDGSCQCKSSMNDVHR